MAMLAIGVKNAPAYGTSLSFDQLNWFGISSSTPDSTWGRVNIDFTGFSSRQFFNLNVNGNWVVQNMGVDSLFGAEVEQTLTTMFDLGVTDGTDVSSIDYVFSTSETPLSFMPDGPLTKATVANLDYQIGGEGDIDLGSPSTPDAPTGGNLAEVIKFAKLPEIDKFVNQVQKKNECAPGAISNSLKYFQARGLLSEDIKTDISDIREIVGTTAEGTPMNWPTIKGQHFKDVLMTEVIAANDIHSLIDAVNAGKDVELDLQGHVAVIVGVRKYSDGRVELDIFDDNQDDDQADAMRTVEIRDGKVDDLLIDGYVVEMPLPVTESTSTLGLLIFGTIGASSTLLSKKKQHKSVSKITSDSE